MSYDWYFESGCIGTVVACLCTANAQLTILLSIRSISASNTGSRFVTQCNSPCMEIRAHRWIRHAWKYAGWQDGWGFLHQPSFSKPAWERQAAFPLDAVENFRPTHHTSEKYNTEHTSTTGLAARIASTVNSYTEPVLVHVQKSYML